MLKRIGNGILALFFAFLTWEFAVNFFNYLAHGSLPSVQDISFAFFTTSYIACILTIQFLADTFKKNR